ncbi:MAG TPA: VOC family protein, partial [Pseudomonas sp.]|nr:VOC family protein [Pseudomonas sp.]
MKLSTYLTYDGNAREAFTFYQQVLGGTLELMTFA